MPSYNHITVIGHLGQDPDLRYTPQGTPICSFTMAVNNRKKVGGEWQDETLWFKIKIWGNQAESASQFLSKGKACLVAGRFEIENWTNRDGKEMTTLVITANEVKFLEKAEGGRPSDTTSDRPRSSTPPASPTPQPDISDDDIPF